MEKFVRQISTSLVQAYGSVTIQIPEVPNLAKEELVKNHNIIERLTGAVVSLNFNSIFCLEIWIFPLLYPMSDHILIGALDSNH